MADADTDLARVLSGLGPLAVAVSGGVDSLTLATAAHRRSGGDAMLAVHATSPAVPPDATARVRAHAAAEGWALRVIDAGEFADPSYRANPVDRCFFCKTNLYAAIGRMTDRTVASGTNADDLGEYRPGLAAARDHWVRHPFVMAGMDKAAVRAMARALGMPAIAALPSSPCLASRVETGIRVDPDLLGFVHAAETLVADALCGAPGAETPPGRAIRCRIRGTGVVVELDPASLGRLAGLSPAARRGLDAAIGAALPARLARGAVAVAPYRTGSAFLTGDPR